MGVVPKELALDLWREAARNPGLQDVVARLRGRLALRFPLTALVVRRLDLKGPRLDTAAVDSEGERQFHAAPQTPLSPEQLEEVLAWIRSGRVLVAARKTADPLLRLLVPTGVDGGVLAVPVADDTSGTSGAALLIGPPGAFGPAHLKLARELTEPLGVALANDHRLHELQRLREAASADRSALLDRLQRDDIADVVVGTDAGMREVMQRVDQVARTDVPVLLFGETGTGKEVVARAVHARSPRAAGPMLRVNCGAIPPGLVDSELFGHERGSFTGAVQTRQGWFERADGGTLFLDEIGELPPDAQVRLLRVLQDGLIERVGGHRPLRVDVRIVAATHRDLAGMVASREFREDLWYRLSVFPIRLPPLRERLSDLPALAVHFAGRAGQRLGGRPLAVEPRDLGLLLGYDWPGNVRELAAVIERAAVLGNGKRLEVASALGNEPGARAAVAAPARPAPPAAPGTGTLEDAARAHIEAALRASRGRIEGEGGAAVQLGLHPATLRSRMRKMKVDWTRYR